MFKLRNTSSFPPGGFSYQQTAGISRYFPPDYSIEELAKIVADFRKGNGLPGADMQSAYNDIEQFTCGRLGAGNQYCFDTDAATNNPLIVSRGGGCGACGAKVE